MSPVPMALALPCKGHLLACVLVAARLSVEEQILQRSGVKDGLAATGSWERWGLLSGLRLFHGALWVSGCLIWCIIGSCVLTAPRCGLPPHPCLGHPGLNPSCRCCLQHGAGRLAQDWREKGKKLTQKYRGKEEWPCPRTTGWRGSWGANSLCPTCCCPPLHSLVGAAGSSWLVLLPTNLEGNGLSASELPPVRVKAGSRGARHVLYLGG